MWQISNRKLKDVISVSAMNRYLKPIADGMAEVVCLEWHFKCVETLLFIYLFVIVRVYSNAAMLPSLKCITLSTILKIPANTESKTTSSSY